LVSIGSIVISLASCYHVTLIYFISCFKTNSTKLQLVKKKKEKKRKSRNKVGLLKGSLQKLTENFGGMFTYTTDVLLIREFYPAGKIAEKAVCMPN